MIPVPFRLALGVVLLVAASAAQAQVYRWVDSSGRVQYSDRKPTNAKDAQQVRNTVSSVGTQSSSASGGKSAAELDKDFQKRRAEQAEAQQKQQQAAADQKLQSQNCQTARENLAALKSGQRIARFTQSGERVYLEDNDRAAEVARNQQIVDSSCK